MNFGSVCSMSDEFQDVIDFWLDEVGPSGWYMPPPGLDDLIRDRYMNLWDSVRRQPMGTFARRKTDSLAVLVLLDQFPRNMFRNHADAFSTDLKALELARLSLDHSLDKKWSFPARQFFYLPFMHSEILSMQERGVRKFLMAGDADQQSILHARAHRWVIRRFGRFPYRNAALGRTSTPAEVAFLEAGGYKAALAEVSGKT